MQCVSSGEEQDRLGGEQRSTRSSGRTHESGRRAWAGGRSARPHALPLAVEQEPTELLQYPGTGCIAMPLDLPSPPLPPLPSFTSPNPLAVSVPPKDGLPRSRTAPSLSSLTYNSNGSPSAAQQGGRGGAGASSSASSSNPGWLTFTPTSTDMRVVLSLLPNPPCVLLAPPVLEARSADSLDPLSSRPPPPRPPLVQPARAPCAVPLARLSSQRRRQARALHERVPPSLLGRQRRHARVAPLAPSRPDPLLDRERRSRATLLPHRRVECQRRCAGLSERKGQGTCRSAKRDPGPP